MHACICVYDAVFFVGVPRDETSCHREGVEKLREFRCIFGVSRAGGTTDWRGVAMDVKPGQIAAGDYDDVDEDDEEHGVDC